MKPETKQFLRQMLACLLCLLLGGGIALGAVWAWMGEDGRTLLSAQHLIAQRFVGDYDETEALHGTLGAMVEGLGDRLVLLPHPRRSQTGPGRTGRTPTSASASP